MAERIIIVFCIIFYLLMEGIQLYVRGYPIKVGEQDLKK